MGEFPASLTCLLDSDLGLGEGRRGHHVDSSNKSPLERRRMMTITGFNCSSGKPDSFVVDMDSFVAGDAIHTGGDLVVDNTHFTMKRSNSKNGRDTHQFLGSPPNSSASSSPTAGIAKLALQGNNNNSSINDKVTTTNGAADQKNPPQVNTYTPPKTVSSTDHLQLNSDIINVDGHQTKPASHNINQTSGSVSKWGRRHSNSCRRSTSTPRAGGSSSSSLFCSPRRVLLFFATLSSMGTMLLIYLTLSMTAAKGQLSGDGFD